jgi:hypothetical protein
MGERIDPTQAPDAAERDDAANDDVEAHRRRPAQLDVADAAAAAAADDDGDDVEGHRRRPAQ